MRRHCIIVYMVFVLEATRGGVIRVQSVRLVSSTYNLRLGKVLSFLMLTFFL